MLCSHINAGIASSDYMESKVTISFIVLVISFIVVLIIIGNLSKSESSVLLPFSSITSIKSAFAVKMSNSSSITNAKLVNELVEKGRILLNDFSSDFHQVLKLSDKALAIDRNNAEAMFNKANALDKLGKHQDAITWYDKMLAINGSDTRAMFNKANALDKLGKHQDAITWYDKMLAINGSDTWLMFNRGLASDKLGKHQEAITWYNKVLAINKNDTDMIHMIGNALDGLGKYQEAITWFDKSSGY